MRERYLLLKIILNPLACKCQITGLKTAWLIIATARKLALYACLDSNQITFGVAARRVTAMIPIAKRVLLKDWATLPGALARNVYLCHVLLSAFVAASYQRL